MSKRYGFVPAVCMLVPVIAFNVDGAAAAEDCIMSPTHDPPEGSHWYYHFDQAKNQKCWVLGEAGHPLVKRAPAPGADHAKEHDEVALSKAQRQALFQEFLRWQELRRTFGSQ